MPTELEELVEFLHHGNTQIRQVATENLVGYSLSQPTIFKAAQSRPITDLKLLVKDYAPIAHDALTILINLSNDEDVLRNLAGDDTFLESLLLRVTNPKEPNANLIAMLLANLTKSDQLKRIMSLSRTVPKGLSASKNAMDQLMDCFVKGAEGQWNPKADFDYLAYVFADVAKFPEGRKYFVTTQAYDGVIPVTKLIVFTEHKSDVRRKGVASTIKNIAFDIGSHPLLLSSAEVNLLPYLLLPLAGPEDYTEEETSDMLPDLQLLPPEKKRDSDTSIMTTHLETLLLLTTTRPARELMRQSGVYPVVRETHLHVDDDGVREACERLVQVLMRDEGREGAAGLGEVGKRGKVDIKGEDALGNEEDEVIEIF